MTTAIILAGGLGTRLREAVPDLPKPMAPVGGKPFLAFLIEYWSAQGIDRFVLSIGYRGETIRKFFGSRYANAAIDYIEENTPLDTGGAALLAARSIPENEPFLLLNGDTYFAAELGRLRNFAAKNAADWCFSLFRTTDTGRYLGLDVAEDGRITALKSREQQGAVLANGGVYWLRSAAVFPSEFNPGEKVSLERTIFPSVLRAGQRLYGVEFGGTFLDIGVPEDFRRASELIER